MAACASISGSFRLTLIFCAAAAVFLLTTDVASAEERRHARLSSDLTERLRVGDQREASVIVTGTDAQVEALAARHGLRITKRLATGAVVDVPAGALATLADDKEADQIVSLAVPGSTLVREQPELVVSMPEGKRLQLSGTVLLDWRWTVNRTSHPSRCVGCSSFRQSVQSTDF